MLGKKLINPGAVACTTDTTQILDGGTTQSTALYRFEDNANDTASSTGKFNKGAVFNGSSSTIDLPTGDLGIGNSNFSISLWFNSANITQNDQSLFWFQHYQSPIRTGAIVSSSASGMGGDYDLRFYCMIGGASYNANSNSDILSSNTWYHAVFVKSSTSGMAIYINGSSTPVATNTSATGNVNTNMTSGGANTIGYYKTSASNHYFNGKIDQFRTFNKALSTSEIATLYNETTTTANTLQVLGDSSCIAAYTFEGNVNDLDTTTPQNGTASNVIYDYNGTESNITYATGKFGKALSYSGASSNIETNLSPSNFTSDYSISFWVKLTNANTFQNFVGNYQNSPSYGGFTFMSRDVGSGVYRFGFIFWYSSGAYYNYVDNNDVLATSGEWAHLVVTKSSSALPILYVNGTANSLNYRNAVTDHGTTSQNFKIGNTLNTNYSAGLIDQLRIFEKSLSPGEVNSLYNETTTTAALGTITNPSTVAYYKMADATDETGSYNGTASTVDFNVEGKYGFASKFNGSSSYISFPSPYSHTSNEGNITVSWWMNNDNVFSNGSFWAILGGEISNSSGNAGTININAYGKGTNQAYISLTRIWGSSARYHHSNSTSSSDWVTMIPGQWYHNVITYDPATNSSKYYVDNTLIYNITFSTYSTSGNATNSTLAWGKYRNGNSYFSGKIDQARFFNKVISADEVTKLYNEIQCASPIATPESYFNTVTYSSPSTSQAHAVGFAPDFIWFKERDGSNSHQLYDTIRTDHKALFSNTDDDEYDYSSHPSGDLAPTITSTGFTTPAVVNNGINNSSGNYVAWAWKAASSNTTNNDGTIASTVRASQKSGFSIATYSANNTVGMSIGHGLSKAPSLVITKRLDADQDWGVYTNVSTGNVTTNWLSLNDADAYGSGNYMNIKSSTLELPTTGAFWSSSSSNQVAYCFANVDGYQRVGSYIGNNSTNGPFVYTGFEPAWLIVKRTDVNGNSWAIFDNKRVESDGDQSVLFADTNTIESDYNIDFVANGFIIKTTTTNVNANGGNYIFLAIAANQDTTAPTKANSFKTVLYSGDNNSSTGQQVTVGFKPDFTWIKQRNISGVRHLLTDSITGPSLYTGAGFTLHTNETFTSNTYGEFTSFDDNGFTVKYWNGSQYFNSTGKNYVAWNWKLADHDRNLPSINNDGSIASIVSANPAAGFSIFRNIGTPSTSSTIGHGLSQAPDLVFQKALAATSDFYVLFKVDGTNWQYAKLNGTDAFATPGTTFGLSSTTINNWGWNGYDMLNFCFHSVTGYSKIDKYSGSGVSGKEVALDFNPSFVLIKRTNAPSGGWVIVDDQRGTKELYPHLNNIEDTTTTNIVLGTNKFTLNTTGSWYNASGGTYLYMAFK